MAPTTNSLMTITDGTTTITIMDSAGSLAYNAAGYRLKYGGFAPVIASKREVLLGGQHPYNDVIQPLTLEIKGSTADDCYTKLETLIRLLDQATRWYFGESVSPVVLKYQPKGSELTAPTQRLILKATPDNDSIVLPNEYDDAGYNYWLVTISIKLLCRGLWYTSLGTDSNSSASTNSGNIVTVTSAINPTLPTPSEIRIDKSATALYTSANVTGYLLLVSQADQIGKIDASSLTGTNITSVADTGNIADGNLMRFTPTVINESRSTAFLNLPQQYKSRRIGFYCTFAITTVSTAVFQCRVAVSDRYGNLYYTPYVSLQEPTNARNPQAFYLGSVVCDEFSNDGTPDLGFNQFALQFIGPESIASTPALDIDTIIVVGLDDDYTHAIKIDFPVSLSGRYLLLRNQPLSRLQPVIHIGDLPSPTAESVIPAVDGNLAVYTKGTTISICYLATVGPLWRLGSVTPTIVSVQYTITRDNAYLIPR